MINLLSGQISIKHGFKGPNHSVVTACATGAHSIGDAAEIIKRDAADIMVAGGAESAVCELGLAGFCAARSLSTGFNDTPEKASRAYDKTRDGFVIAGGAGVLVMEEYEHAKQSPFKLKSEQVPRAIAINDDGYGKRHATVEDIITACDSFGMIIDKELQVEQIQKVLGKKGFITYNKSQLEDIFEERETERMIFSFRIYCRRTRTNRICSR